jgi:ribonuclease BN (tRNA processing enzyme)
MQLRVLGCSGGFGAGLRTTAFLLDQDVLIDAGTGVGDLAHEEMRQVRHVFLTHSHLDHVASLPLLVDTLFDELAEPLVVHAQQCTIDALQEHLFNGQIWPDFSALPDPSHPVLRYEALAPGDCVRLGDREFSAIPVRHTVPTVAYRCATADAAFCFSGDTTTNETLWPALNEAGKLDLLVVEVGFPDREEKLAHLARHYCPSLLARDLAQLDGRPRIGVTHLKAGHEDETMDELAAALPGHDLYRLQAGESIQL